MNTRQGATPERRTRPQPILRFLFASIALAASLILFSLGNTARAEDYTLVLTEKDFDAMQVPDEDEDVERCFGSPSITVEQPSQTNVQMPVPVDIRFVPLGQSTVNLDTLRIRIGLIDVTKRVLESLKVSPDGITGTIDGAKPGNYKFKIKLYDSLNRCGKAILQFKVVKPPPKPTP